MTPNLGQGGCQAIEDAIVLDRCLSQESDAATAFRKYETARLARTARVVKEARRFGALGQIENGAMCAVRDFAMRVAPASAGIRSVAWLYSYEA